MKLGTQLKQILAAKNITVAQLSKATKISSKTVYHWLNGQSPRNLDQLKLLSDYLEVDLNYLLFNDAKIKKNEFQDYEDEIKAGIYEVVLRKIKQSKST